MIESRTKRISGEKLYENYGRKNRMDKLMAKKNGIRECKKESILKIKE